MNRKDLESEMGIALNKLLKKYKSLGFVGRCWGILKDNFLGGSHVTLAQGNTIVSIHINNQNQVAIHEYEKTKRKTILGNEVREIIKNETGLEIANP